MLINICNKEHVFKQNESIKLCKATNMMHLECQQLFFILKVIKRYNQENVKNVRDTYITICKTNIGKMLSHVIVHKEIHKCKSKNSVQ